MKENYIRPESAFASFLEEGILCSSIIGKVSTSTDATQLQTFKSEQTFTW